MYLPTYYNLSLNMGHRGAKFEYATNSTTVTTGISTSLLDTHILRYLTTTCAQSRLAQE